ncbi:hypothetical protein ACQRBN_07175 [Bariatricus sp. SGI.154]|uniref:hypothetical protein n=1 Tax=Bariatricus sp. SGI.154 TaxID=3420549 RepID=UPI003D089752
MMNEEILRMTSKFNRNNDSKNQIIIDEKLKNHIFDYSDFLAYTDGGNGLIGDNNYLILWRKDDLNDLNSAYEVETFLPNVFLIGSDGGDMAYGIDNEGQYIQVPFIGMSIDEMLIVSHDFKGFLKYLEES